MLNLSKLLVARGEFGYIALPMKYRVVISGETFEVDVQKREDGSYGATLGGKAVQADVISVPGGHNLILDGRVYDILVGGTEEETHVAVRGERGIANVQSERQMQSGRRKAGGAANKKELRSPMPGRVVKVLCKAGDEVQPGQTLIIVEAMKMENELKAAGPAKIANVAVAEGASIESNGLLVSFE